MKIGILTFHEVYNPGAFLQALGTFNLLKSLGHDPQIIDYTSPAHRFSMREKILNVKSWKNPIGIYEHWGRHKAFLQSRNLLKFTPKLLNHKDTQKQFFDAVLIGADIVWDFLNPRLGYDSIYFGEFLNSKRIISFAASCGSASHKEAPAYAINGLNSFHSISVRDMNTLRFVKESTGKEAQLICDPAFHVNDVDVVSESPGEVPYLLVYANPGTLSRDIIIQTKAYAKKNNLKTIAVCYRQKWTNKNDICINPQKWLSYIRNAEAVVTNTFHGTLFCTKAGVQFVCELNDDILMKTETMMKKLSIQHRFFGIEDRNVNQILSEKWDINCIAGNIESWRSEAKQFLIEALS